MQKKVKDYIINNKVETLCIRRFTRCENKRHTERVKLHLLLKVMNLKDVVEYFGIKMVDKIPPQDINSFIQKERTRKVRGKKTFPTGDINHNRGYLHRVFEFAMNVYGWVQTNPVNNIDPLPQDNMRTRVLSPEEKKYTLALHRQRMDEGYCKLHTGNITENRRDGRVKEKQLSSTKFTTITRRQLNNLG